MSRGGRPSASDGGGLVQVLPLQYIHILDRTTNVSYVEEGPQTIILQAHQELVVPPAPFVVVPPGHYCRIIDPVDRSKYEKGKPCTVKFGEVEIRFHSEPFSLYPGEQLGNATPHDYKSAIKALPIVKANQAIVLEASIDHTDDTGAKRVTGEKWQLPGPRTHKPTAHTINKGIVDAQVILPGHALHLRANQDFTDVDDVEHVTGEEWLVKKEGAYLPHVHAKVVQMVSPYVLIDTVALYIHAKRQLKDALGNDRCAGELYMVTNKDTDYYVPGVSEEVIKSVKKTVLTSKQYCVVMDPVGEDGHNQLGQRELRTGPSSFFLRPGEHVNKIEAVHIMGDDEALLLRAMEEFTDGEGDDAKKRSPGDIWMIRGPCDFTPCIQVSIVEKRKAIPLGKNEGIYVRETQSGKVRTVLGPQSYLLTATEQLIPKTLPTEVEAMLKSGGGLGDESIRKVAYFETSVDPALLMGPRDPSRLVTYRCPHNTAVQVYDYQRQRARVVFGPDLATLGYHENFNVLSLSAGKPKKEGALKSLALMLGPDFTTDIIEVETSDHARLSVKLAFNNHFEVERGNAECEAKIFAVPDFIGFACRQVASRIRGAVAQISFDEFHRNSQRIIRTAVLGVNEDGKIKSCLKFDANNLVITGIDIQSIEPSDARMRDSLTKSVQMAIEISTNSIERSAQHDAARLDQVARGHLERQNLQNEKLAEEARMKLFELQAESAAVESSGQAKAEASAQAEKLLIEGQADIAAAQLRAQAAEIEHAAALESRVKAQEAEILYQKSLDQIQINRAKEQMSIEVSRFAQTVGALDGETMAAIATAPPAEKRRLIKAIGLNPEYVPSGDNPMAMFNFDGSSLKSAGSRGSISSSRSSLF
ncbi:major vault protein-like [Sycon ciliatum]|uniref:major vault protein-like n=1 Tax=Sycon ciliatum TaxID=27933 RepID=UPI0020AC8CCB